MNLKKFIGFATISLVFIIIASGIILSVNMKSKVKELFILNRELQEEGYYMADFEFRMLGFSYLLDKGRYYKALKSLSAYHGKLRTKEGLKRIPSFTDSQQETDFFLDLQDPVTGAFIDDSAPFCIYIEITRNIIGHLASLKNSDTVPLKLKYPLKFLDEINTPEKLLPHLDDISYVGWLASKFPQTTFHFSRNLLGETGSENVLENNGVYQFSPEWKHAMLKWMYDFQDTATGFWGPRNRKTHKLTKLDLNNTASILKSYRDNDGNDIYTEFPLKYKDKLFSSAIGQLSEPYPDHDDLPEIHEWNLRQGKGIKMLLRHLWKDASVTDRKDAEKIILRYIDINFEKYYVRDEGAFSYYPDAGHASCDGNHDILNGFGALSGTRQRELWGDPAENTRDLGALVLNEIKSSDMEPVAAIPGINSLRFYLGKPDFEHLCDSVWAVYYPGDTLVPDVMELVPNIIRWTNTTTLSMGNWSSMAEIRKEFSKYNIEKPLVFKNELPRDEIKKKFEETTEIFVVGFDKLQIPRGMIKFKYTDRQL
ncbi:MAG TPA: hypothetical protein P5180_00495 [Bacteroidales bacterium]|nr:hypothetical protein [Bacteroidales bacterium]HPF01974.1 hypothetical protein [Bacteroidales bacterium]HPJ60218.1 hypothetical protein [Bacteroidales bacterium]HRW83883.1 hypothetical protein [Bacteroidales bacterium]